MGKTHLKSPRFYALVLAALLPGLALAATMSVQVRQSPVRQSPVFLSPVVEMLSLGAKVEAKEDMGDWVRVKAPSGKEGWMHSAALTDQKVDLKAGEGNQRTTAEAREVALAGKGFSKEVENSYRAAHPQEAFAAVDKMEARKFGEDEVRRFMADGGLSVPGEGAK